MKTNPLAIGVEAARRVTVEVFTVLGEYSESITLVGGSTPPLLVGETREDPYVGTLDVDLLIDPLEMPADAYDAIGGQLEKRNYVRGQRPFQWLRQVRIEGQDVEVRVDLLAVPTEARGKSHLHESIEPDVVARRLVGSELVRGNFEERSLTARMPDGRNNKVNIRIAGAASFIVLKALAIAGRDKTKDCYDVDYVLAHVAGGPDRVAEDLVHFPETEPVTKAIATLRDKFATPEAYGPGSVAVHRGLDPESEEGANVRAVAFARVGRLLKTYDEHRAASTSVDRVRAP